MGIKAGTTPSRPHPLAPSSPFLSPPSLSLFPLPLSPPPQVQPAPQASTLVTQAGGWPPSPPHPYPTLGYEAVTVGPTTNIVGDRMTTAAVDAVHAELAGAAAPAPALVALTASVPAAGGLVTPEGAGCGGAPPSGTGTEGGGEGGLGPHGEGRNGLGRGAGGEGEEGAGRFRALWGRLAAQGRLPQACLAGGEGAV